MLFFFRYVRFIAYIKVIWKDVEFSRGILSGRARNFQEGGSAPVENSAQCERPRSHLSVAFHPLLSSPSAASHVPTGARINDTLSNAPARSDLPTRMKLSSTY